MRPKPLYYQTDNDTLSVWKCGNCGISWLLEKSSTTDELRNTCAWLSPPSRVRSRIWKKKLASSCSSDFSLELAPLLIAAGTPTLRPNPHSEAFLKILLDEINKSSR